MTERSANSHIEESSIYIKTQFLYKVEEHSGIEIRFFQQPSGKKALDI